MIKLIEEIIRWEDIGSYDREELSCRVKEAVLEKETSIFTLTLALNFVMPYEDDKRLRAYILNGVPGLKKVNIRYIYDSPMAISDSDTVRLSIPHIISEINGSYSKLTRTIKTGTAEFDENANTITLFAIGAVVVQQLNKEVAGLFMKVLKRDFNITATVQFLNNEEEARKLSEERERLEAEELAEAEQRAREAACDPNRGCKKSDEETYNKRYAGSGGNAAGAAKGGAKPAGGWRSKRDKYQPVEGNLIMGKPVGDDAAFTDLRTVTAESGSVNLRGILFSKDSRDIQGGQKKLASLAITDKKTSIGLKCFCLPEKWADIDSNLSEGDFIKVHGEAKYDDYEHMMTVMIDSIEKGERPAGRKDTCEEKRVELHAHTQMSAMDGLNPVANLVHTAAMWGQPAVAVTDHGVVQSFPDAHAQAEKEAKSGRNIKIIYGMEGYLVESKGHMDAEGKIDYKNQRSYHIIIIARNQTGLKNLYKLVSYSHINYFYKKPRLPRSVIEEHREGLILGSACSAGELYYAILEGKTHEELLEIASFYDYLEIQPLINNRFLTEDKTTSKGEIIPKQVQDSEGLRNINRKIIALADELGKPVVATTDTHYAEPEDAIYRNILMAGPLDIITKRLVELAQGDAASPVPEITGCREIAELRDSTTTIVDTLDGLTKEVTNIAMGSVSGDLGIRGRAENFEGAYRDLVDGINNMMDAIIRPLRKAAEYMHRIGVGDVPEKLDSNYAGEFGEIAGSINFCIDAVNKLIEDTSYIAEAAVAGDFSRRGDLDKHSGDFRKIIAGVNETLDVVADKAAWYQAILDCVPFPIQVTDNDLKLTFVNVNCAHQFIKDGIIKEHRIECYGMEAVDSRCALTSPENSGPKKMLEKGISESEFMMGDSTFKQETSWLTNRKLEKLGLVEIALDQTAVLKALSDAENMSKQQQAIGEYQNRAVEKLVVNLEKLASGDLSLDMEIEPSDKDTAEVAANFTKINENLARCTNAIRALVADANMMYQAAMAGDLDMRAETDKHGGEYANVVKGINATMDAIMEPVQASLKVIAAMAEGDLQQRMTGDYQGNYNMIKNAVNTTCDNMQGYVSEIARVLEGIGQGNLDQAVTAEYKGDFVQIKTSLNSILDSLNSIMGQINQLAEGVTQGSKNVSEGSQNLSNASTQQAATVQELSNTMSRVSQQIKQNTQDAQKASTVSTDVMHRAEQGNSQMKEMLISMADINESSANISKIIKVIDDIAFQTNILALNAAVEAARAGVHGKGFAVVADEVRSLAAKSAAAASETTTLIEGSVSKVDAGTKIADATAKALEAIVEGITETSGLCVEIAEVSEQQNEGINEVNRGIEEVSKVVQSNSATAEQSAALSGELYSQAQAMKQMVATFKLKGDSRTMLLPGK